MGFLSSATKSGAIAIGANSQATGDNSWCVGTGCTAGGSGAIGAFALAANGGNAFGDRSVATGSLSTALGPGASATAANSVAIGAGSIATAPNTVSFGSPGNERRLTNIAPGIGPTDAATFGQLTDVGKEARRGIAASVALAAPMTPSARGKTTITTNTGFFRGETAVGVAVAHRLNISMPIVIQGGYANGGGREHAGRVGMGFEF